MNEIRLKVVEKKDLEYIWQISYGTKADLEWMKFNGPYFNEPVLSWEVFLNGYGNDLVNNPFSKKIVSNGNIVGLVTAYWEDGNIQQWLEVGIVLYDSTSWGKGIGSKSLSLWINELFDYVSYLPHIGFTTWSGNIGMQKIGEKCDMTKEGVIRKVRYLNGVYYDSVKYGILREEVL